MATWQDFRHSIRRANQIVDFWWRDDDAHRSDPQLDRLLSISSGFDVPLSLAVVPGWLQPSLGEALSQHGERLSCLLHGYAHENHAIPPERKCEYPASRDVGSVSAELQAGVATLHSALPDHWLGLFVPPWNRMAVEHYPALRNSGLIGLSARFNNSPVPGLCNLPVHVDIIDWQQRQFRGQSACLNDIISLIDEGASHPIGIMTHHLDHDEGCWVFLEELFSELRGLPNCRVLSARDCTQNA